MIHGRFTVKKLLAVCLTLTLTAGMMGISGNDRAISGSADNQPEVYETELDSLKEQQKALDKKIEEAEAEIEKQKGDIEALKDKYTAVKAKIDNVEDQLAKNEDAMVELDTRLREARLELEEKNAEIEALRGDFMERLKTMYVAGGANTYENVLVNSADFYDVLMRLELVKRVAEHDDEALDELMEKKRQAEAVQAEIEDSAAKLKESTSQYAAMRDELNAQKKELSKVIEDSDGKLDTMALDKAAMELRAEQLTKDYDEAYSKAHTTTAAPVTEETPAVAETAEAVTSKQASKAPAVTTEKKQEETKKVTTSEAVTEETRKVTTEQTTTTKATTKAETEKPQETTAEVVTTTEKATETEAPVTTAEVLTTAETTTTTTTTVTETEADVVEEEDDEDEAPASNVTDDSSRQEKIDAVMEYARSNVGGAYVWAGSSFRATDCSGLVMLSYSQIGIEMPHLAELQAQYGTEVSYDELQEGDLVFFGSAGNVYHVAIYNGNGRIVHAANSDDGIIFSDLASFSASNPIYCLRRII